MPPVRVFQQQLQEYATGLQLHPDTARTIGLGVDGAAQDDDYKMFSDDEDDETPLLPEEGEVSWDEVKDEEEEGDKVLVKRPRKA